jgi:hypothetical protein
MNHPPHRHLREEMMLVREGPQYFVVNIRRGDA